MALYKTFEEWTLVLATENRIFSLPMMTLSSLSDEEKMEKLLYIKVVDPVNNRTRSIRCDKAIPFCGRADADVEVPPEVERYFTGEIPEDLTPLVEWFISSFYTNYVEVAGIPYTGHKTKDAQIEMVYDIYVDRLLGAEVDLQREAESFFYALNMRIPRELFGTVFEGIVFSMIDRLERKGKLGVVQKNFEVLSKDDIALILKGAKFFDISVADRVLVDDVVNILSRKLNACMKYVMNSNMQSAENKHRAATRVFSSPLLLQHYTEESLELMRLHL